MLKRLMLLATLLATLLVAACQSGAPSAAEPTAAPSTAEPTDAPTVEPTAADSPAPTAAEQPAAGSTRTITDATGESVEVPVAPQRVVALSEQDADAALALEASLVGVVNGRGQQTPPRYLLDRLTDVESVGDFNQPSLEKIVALNPDLILIGGIFPQIEALLPQLREIAPTVVTYRLEDSWKTALAGTADALNRQSEAEAFLAAYDARIEQLRTAIGPQAQSEVSIVRWNPNGPAIMALDSFASTVLRDIGLQRPASQQIPGYSHSEPLSLEQLEQLDADWLFLGTLNPDGAQALESARSSPLFEQLDAVKNNHVVAIDGALWTSRGGPLAALIVLDDVEQALAGA